MRRLSGATSYGKLAGRAQYWMIKNAIKSRACDNSNYWVPHKNLHYDVKSMDCGHVTRRKAKIHELKSNQWPETYVVKVTCHHKLQKKYIKVI